MIPCKGVAGRPKPAGGGQAKTPGYMKQRRPEDVEAEKIRWAKPATWTLLFLGLLGGALYYWLFRPICPPLLVVGVTQYPSPYLPNPWAEEDVGLLEQLDLKRDDVVRYIHLDVDKKWWSAADEQVAARLLAEQLQEKVNRPGGPNRDVVLLYFNMHGAVNKDGDPCLIPPGVPGGDAKGWFSVEKLLSKLFNAESGMRESNVKYLVIFDCNRVEADWAWDGCITAFRSASVK